METMEEPNKKRVCIVGAGISGLSAAYELHKKGVEVVVYEKNDFAGGRMSSRRGDNFTFDTGADFLSENYEQLKKYAVELHIPWVSTKENGKHRIVRGEKAYYLDMKSAGDVFKMGVISFWSKLKFVLWLISLSFRKNSYDFFDLSKTNSKDDLESAGEFLRRRVGTEVRDYIADPFTSLMQFHLTDEISLGAMRSLMKMMITPGKGFVLRCTPGGIGRIPQTIAKKVGVQYGVNIKEILRTTGGARVTKEDGNSEIFDAVVVATTADIANTIIKDKTEAEGKLFSKVKYAPTIVVALEVPCNLLPDGTHLTYVPFVENQIIGGYTNESRKGDDFICDKSMLINVYLHGSIVHKFSDKSDKEIADEIIPEFVKVCPELRKGDFGAKDVKLHDVKRWEHAMPKFYPGYLSAVREFLDEGQGQGSVYLAGDYLNSPWAEGAARCGVRIAEKIMLDFYNTISN